MLLQIRYTLFNDGSDECTTGAQPALSLRLGPQIQTLLSREGRAGGCRTGQSRSRNGCRLARGGRADSHTITKAPDAPALEGDHVPRLRSEDAHAAQGRWKLSEVTPSTRSALRRETGRGASGGAASEARVEKRRLRRELSWSASIQLQSTPLLSTLTASGNSSQPGVNQDRRGRRPAAPFYATPSREFHASPPAVPRPADQ